VSSLRYINPDSVDPPIGEYSHVAIVEGGAALVHVAGQLPLDSDGKLVGDDFTAQADHVFANLAAVLGASGSAMDRILYLRTYLTSDEDYARFKAARAQAFERHGVVSPPPATTIIVAGLVGGSRIELDAVAAGRDRS
jgi:enamine deaminase RidA (YjgF/YER057c/UK114 family)